MESFDELVALRLQEMTKCEALDIAIDHLELNPTVATEAAGKLLIVMRNRLQGGNNDDITEAHVPWV